jgi:hypothetical protein
MIQPTKDIQIPKSLIDYALKTSEKGKCWYVEWKNYKFREKVS